MTSPAHMRSHAVAIVEKQGGTFRQLDDMTVEIVVPVSGKAGE